MRAFEWLIGAVLVLAVMALLIGLMLPSQLVVSRSLVIAAPPERVYAVIRDLRHYEDFLPWNAPDSDIVYRYPGATSGVAARMEWQAVGSQVSVGSLEITAALEDRRIEMQVRHDRDSRMMDNWLQLQPVEAGTRVEWGMRKELGWGLLGRYTAVLFDDAIGAQYERGLKRLRGGIEHGAADGGEATS